MHRMIYFFIVLSFTREYLEEESEKDIDDTCVQSNINVLIKSYDELVSYYTLEKLAKCDIDLKNKKHLFTLILDYYLNHKNTTIYPRLTKNTLEEKRIIKSPFHEHNVAHDVFKNQNIIEWFKKLTDKLAISDEAKVCFSHCMDECMNNYTGDLERSTFMTETRNILLKEKDIRQVTFISCVILYLLWHSDVFHPMLNRKEGDDITKTDSLGIFRLSEGFPFSLTLSFATQRAKDGYFKVYFKLLMDGTFINHSYAWLITNYNPDIIFYIQDFLTKLSKWNEETILELVPNGVSGMRKYGSTSEIYSNSISTQQ